MRKTKLGRSIFTIILSFLIVFQMVAPQLMAFAAISDKDTSTKYTESLGDNVSTEYAGRVWTDKSVYDGDVAFETFGGGSETVILDAAAGEDFLIAYSALATSESISGQTQAPVDVVLILDISGSMSNASSNMDNGKSRIYNAVQAANAAIDDLMTLNPYTRIAVVAFSNNAQVLLPLGRYSKTMEREWVSTGNRPNQGYWRETGEELPYFTLSRETGSNNYATLYTNAINSDTNATIEKETSVEGGTNIQVGLYEGMQVLAEATVTTANINGQEVKRVPSVILLSDGAPTYSSDSDSWWAPEDNNDDGPGSEPYAGNGMKAILVGSYMKDAIDRNYGVAGTAFATTVYTVGMGITGLDDDEMNLAYMTLDPGTYWDDTSVTNSMKTTIKNYWASYTANNNTGTLNINVGRKDGNGTEDKRYYLTHPSTGYDVDLTNGYDYVDDYYDADNAAAVTQVFEQIVSNISITAPQVPTEVKGDDPLTDGYITYTDPIGQYMEVKDVKSIIYAGTQFTQKTKTVSGTTTTYTFSGEVHSPVYGDQNVENIIITVDKDASGNEMLTVKIPASVIPLRVNEVTLNEDGSVKTHTNNGAYPARVVYSVGLKDGIKKTSDDGHEYVDTTALSAEYLASNTNDDGTVNFYSNLYTKSTTVNGSTAGDAKVEFEPSHTNPFYYIQQDMPIYKNRDFTEMVTEEEGLDDDAIYYYKEEYYHGGTVEVTAIARTGAQLTATEITTGEDGNLYRAAGSPRLNRILEFEGTKSENATNTAEDFYAPTFQLATDSTDPFDGKFVIYLGNNGLLSLPAGGNLQISKDVAAAAGLTAPGETFVFTIDLDGSNINGGTYGYDIKAADGSLVSTGTVSASNATISLQDGQTATIYSLPPSTTYTVTEAAVAGFAQESEGASGTIHAGTTQQAKFTNTYSVKSVTSEEIQGKKLLSGLTSWPSNYSFTFFLTPYNDGPLPVGYDEDAGVTVTADDASGLEAAFSFGTIEFTTPGTYRYTVVEKEPENDGYLPGVTYSRALFRLVYVVVDNGDGTLRIQSSDIQRLYDDSANQLFTYDSNDQIVMNDGEEAQDSISFINTYSAADVTRVPIALKNYTDNSGTKPLVSGMFQFQLKAIGYIVDDGDLNTNITAVPMPAGSQDGVCITTNEGHNITFPAVTFTQQLLTNNNASKMTYRYEMSEVIPEDEDKVPGMEYDDAVYTIDVVVEFDTTGQVLKVSAIYPNDQRIVSFNNTYTLEPVTTDINGTKTLNGRDMKDDETFKFELVGANAATNNTVRDGIVVVPTSSATVSNGKNGQAVAFSFPEIQFNRPGTYSFLVYETAGDAPSVTYDDSIVTVTVVIADTNNDAKLEVVSTTYSDGGNTADFVNTYTYKFNDTPIKLEGTKNLTGKSLLAGEFFFLVEEYYNGSYVTEQLVSHTGDDTATNGVFTGSITFLEDVTYTEPGVYRYDITEQIPDDEHKVGGTKYDTARYRYTVTVEDDRNGNLKVTSKILEKADGVDWKTVESVVFSNSYTPNPTTAQLPLIEKVISGDRSIALKENEFSFELKLVSADPADGIILPTQTVVGNAENGNIEFGDITFIKAGTYTLSVKEIIPDDAEKVPAITYSTQEIIAVFHVEDDRNGVLTATLTQFNGGDTIINEYTAQPATAVITGTKQYAGMNMLDFQFTLTGEIGTQKIEETKTLDKAAKKVTFTELTFPAAGTYTFTVQEEQSIAGGFIVWDENVYTVTIKVEDNGVGQLEVISITYTNADNTPADEILFRNGYDLGNGELGLTVKKNMTGDRTDPSGFEFGLYTDLAAEPIDKVTSDGDGVVSFKTITYKPADLNGQKELTKTYYIKEIRPVDEDGKELTKKDGITYDTKVYTVVVTLTDDEEGNIQVSYTVDGSDVDESDYVFVFSNSYDAETATHILEATKEYDGLNMLDFQFTLTGEIGTQKIEETKTLDKATKKVTFTELTFPAAGIYTFEVKEEKSILGGFIVWDENVYTVEISVEDLGLGYLKVTDVSYRNADNTPADDILFHNGYDLGDGELGLTVKKNMTGDRTDPSGFEFGLYTDLAAEPIDKVTSDEDGVVSFKIITYKPADLNGQKELTKTYYIKEIRPVDEDGEELTKKDGITYDTKVYTVVVTLTDNEEGNIQVSYTVDGSDVDESTYQFAFSNSYYAEDASTAISGTKTLVGGGLEPGKFTFKLYKTDSTYSIVGKDAIATAVNAADGSFTFNKDNAAQLNYTEEGIHYYVLVEDDTDPIADIRYDRTVYKFKVVVTDNKVGSLVADLQPDASNPNSISFRNVPYEYITKKDVFLATDPTVSIDGKKVVAGDELIYTISYTNYNGATSTVTITDIVPKHTTYVPGSASDKGVYADGVLTWTMDVPADETVTVSFKVTVDAANAIFSNEATVLDGRNTYTTNDVYNHTVEDIVEKDVFRTEAPTVSIDGKEVEVNDTLQYTITYRNATDKAVALKITDAIPAHTTYVEGSADNGGVLADGILTWNLNLDPWESVTVTFQVKVADPGVTLTNQAQAFDGTNEFNSNVVSSSIPTPSDVPDTSDSMNMILWSTMLLFSTLAIIVLSVFKKRFAV